MLRRMFAHLADDSMLKAYITQNCSSLLEEPTGDTGFPCSYFDADKFLSNPSTRKLASSFTKSLVEDLVGKSGVYAFYSQELDQYYVGANLDFLLRLRLHYHNDGDKLLYNAVDKLGGFNHFHWQAINVSPNYYMEFVKDNPQCASDYETYRILSSFSKYETRLLEQSFKTFLQPGLNGAGNITFPVNWHPEDIRSSSYSVRPFVAITEAGQTYKFPSLNNGATILGTSRKTIETLMNFEDAYTDCPEIKARCCFFEKRDGL